MYTILEDHTKMIKHLIQFYTASTAPAVKI